MTDRAIQKKKQRELIERKRIELSEQIDASADGEVLYKLSVELDQLISQYMEH